MARPDFDDPDMMLSEMFAHWPETAAAFLNRRMLCPGCPIAPFHAVVDACGEYDLDEGVFRAELRALAGLPANPRRR
ncbi:DUF1858 domain-containing protein [Oceaniglobus trochenteri]|uniref:DUF1858 domain-containing protein n=1 Tax=Oceaniglobus trochenteri TaxID=2763260 RepID=UPI001CFF5D7E|nr:DUF1858 domain-containing protein [Oceaniglobus trochenteri]